MIGTLQDRRVIVLGGSSGIGYAVAEQAQVGGASVFITGRDAERLGAAQEAGNGPDSKLRRLRFGTDGSVLYRLRRAD
jgi:NAD(P)-dependent dehydrogenase (short-subunit alcohol dehydrogenase family)